MIQNLSNEHNGIHQRALKISREYRNLEWQMLEVVELIDRTKLYKPLGYSSLFQYAVGALKLSESVAYSFISVARKAADIGELKRAIQDHSLSVSKASRVIPALNPANAANLLEFAKNHSSREIDFEVARLNPKTAVREKAKPVSGERVMIRLSVSKNVYEDLRRAQSLAAKTGDPRIDLEGTLDAVLKDYLKRHDPVKKAARAVVRQEKRARTSQERRAMFLHGKETMTKGRPHELRPNGVEVPKTIGKPGRIRLTAKENHEVHLRDHGQCTFIDSSGKRCPNDRWVEIHHIIPVAEGGSNEVSNLTTLCAFHHDLVHQLSLPIDGQINWVKSPSRPYLLRSLIS
jgi:5-methylcytosine-specific restriction endonuclease McrA